MPPDVDHVSQAMIGTSCEIDMFSVVAREFLAMFLGRFGKNFKANIFVARLLAHPRNTSPNLTPARQQIGFKCCPVIIGDCTLHRQPALLDIAANELANTVVHNTVVISDQVELLHKRTTLFLTNLVAAANLQYADVSTRELESFRVKRGDILFNRTNSFELVGRTAVFDLDGDYVFASYLIRLRTLEAVLDPFFLNAYLNAQRTQRRLKGIATRAVSQSNISASRLRGFVVPVPPLAEQKKIARVLGLVQRAVEQQERLIALTAELKSALLHHLFSQGLRGEPQKQTEIGTVPESWRVAKLGEYLTAAQYGISAKGSESGRYAVLRMTNQRQGRISSDNLQFVELTADQFHRFRVERQDILFNRTNSFDLVGRTAIFDLEGDFVFASYLIRLRTNGARLRPFFLNHYLSWGGNTEASEVHRIPGS
jgi:Type I restriction modification DNA specificity domain